MKPIDFAKAAGVATAVLALNVLIAILVVLGYSFVIEPGHPSEFYDAAALRIAPWCSHIAGTALFFGAGYLFAKRRPQRNGYLFAAAFTVFYAVIDGATVGFVGVFAFEHALSILAKLLAALAGAFLATRGESMQTEMSLEIERPIKEVFDYTTNNVAEWCSVVVKDEVIDKKPEGVGTTFRVITEERDSRMELDGVVTRHEPPTAHAVFMKGKQVDIEAEYLFKDLGGRTRVTQRSTVNGKGFVKVIFFLFGWSMRKSSRTALEKELLSLKRLIEAR